MPVPAIPAAALALRFGAVALTAWAVARRIEKGRTDQRAEDALDDLPDGVTAHRPRDREQVNATARFNRRVTFGKTGLAFDVDAAMLGRFKIKRA